MSTYPTYQSVRDEKLKLISDTYYRLLNDYIQSYNQYLNGQNGITSDMLTQKNNNLLTIATQLQSNNHQVSQDANNIMKNYQSTDKNTTQGAADIAQLNNDLNSRYQDYTSSQQYSEQMQQLTRHQYKIFWLRLFLIIVLFVGIAFIVRKLQTNFDLFKATKDMAQDAVETVSTKGEAKNAGGRLLSFFKKLRL